MFAWLWPFHCLGITEPSSGCKPSLRFCRTVETTERHAQARVKTMYAAKDNGHGFPFETETEANCSFLQVRRPSNEWSAVLPPAGWGARRIIPS